MNKEQKYTSLPLSKKIDALAKKKGIESESEYVWATDNAFIGQDDMYILKLRSELHEYDRLSAIPALDTSEWGEILPKHTSGYFLKIQIDNKFYFSTYISEDDDENLHQEEEETMAEAMGQMYFYLLDNNLL